MYNAYHIINHYIGRRSFKTFECVNFVQCKFCNINYIEKGGYLSSEVSNVKCFNLTECQKIIRPYYLSKLNAIKKGFQIIHCMNNYFE